HGWQRRPGLHLRPRGQRTARHVGRRRTGLAGPWRQGHDGARQGSGVPARSRWRTAPLNTDKKGL
ncbi:DNA binding protein, partial [Clostridium botulinum NCTC 2916]